MKTKQERRASFLRHFNTALEAATHRDDTVTIASIMAGDHVKEAVRLFDAESEAEREEYNDTIDRVAVTVELVKAAGWDKLPVYVADAVADVLAKYLRDD